MVYFDLDIINEGYYKDVFQFEIETENELLALMDEQALTLEPGETTKITLSILTPEKLFDPGTPNNIQIYVYSSGNSTKTLISTLTVITRGIYISPLVLIISIPIILLIIFFYILFIKYNDIKIFNRYGKIDKPWNIPIEQKYLQELKEKNKEEYVKTIDMMKDEYKSSLLWYKDYIKNSKSNKSNSKEVIRNFFNNQKNNIKNVRKQKDKKESDKPVIIPDENLVKNEKTKSKKLFSNIPKKLKFRNEKNHIDKNVEDDEINKKTITEIESQQDNKEIVKNEEDQKIERAKYLENKKNREKEKTIQKIRKLQDKQRKKINK